MVVQRLGRILCSTGHLDEETGGVGREIACKNLN